MYTYYRLPLTVAVLIVVAFATSANGETDKDRLGVGSKAPALDVEHWISDGDGKFSSVSQFKPGHVYVVEFWATWCRPCVASMPHLSELQKKYQDKDLQIISISDEDLETVQAFLERPTREDDGVDFRTTDQQLLLDDGSRFFFSCGLLEGGGDRTEFLRHSSSARVV